MHHVVVGHDSAAGSAVGTFWVGVGWIDHAGVAALAAPDATWVPASVARTSPAAAPVRAIPRMP